MLNINDAERSCPWRPARRAVVKCYAETGRAVRSSIRWRVGCRDALVNALSEPLQRSARWYAGRTVSGPLQPLSRRFVRRDVRDVRSYGGGFVLCGACAPRYERSEEPSRWDETCECCGRSRRTRPTWDPNATRDLRFIWAAVRAVVENTCDEYPVATVRRVATIDWLQWQADGVFEARDASWERRERLLARPVSWWSAALADAWRFVE